MRMASAILKDCSRGLPFMFFIHKSVDGDCVGSACGMVEVLRSMGHEAWVAKGEELPYNMQFLGVEDLFADPAKMGPFVPFAVDCSDSERMGTCSPYFDDNADPLIIDHHISVKLRGEKIWIGGEASSACELCYYTTLALEEKTGKKLITERAARCFLTGIVTDTGRFTYTNTKPETLIAAGELLELGGNVTEISYNQYDRKKPEAFKASALIRSNVRFYCDGKIALAIARADDFARFGADDSAIEELPSALRDIDGVELSIILRESGGVIRCNLRSKEYFDCSEFATEFNGGGHYRAAGFTHEMADIEEVAQKVVAKASERL